MARLFKREVAVTLVKPLSANQFFRYDDVVRITDLRVQFNVEKNLASDPNTCEVTITNLADLTRGLFRTKPLGMRLDAGYDGELQRLFSGDMRWSESKHNGTDWETMAIVADGDRAHRFARVNRSYKAGVDCKAALRDIAKSMGLTLPKELETSSELQKQFAAGLTLHGSARRELERILKPLGLDYSIQDGRLQILSESDVRKDEPVLISQDKGLIGTPEFGQPPSKGRPATLTFACLLYPNLIPGGRVRMDSLQIKGVYKIQRVTHAGDTHGEVWESRVEAIPV